MSETQIRVVVVGARGRMGAALCRLVAADARFALAAVTEQAANVAAVSSLGAPAFASLAEALSAAPADVVIDFSSPAASVEHARVCAARHVALVVGTTGMNAEQHASVAAAGQQVPLVLAANMSVGVTVMAEVAAHLGKTLGAGWDVEIVETHHKLKKDAPSGTALALFDAVAGATGRTRKDLRATRDGVIGERTATEIGVQALRGGDVVGEHTVFFFGEGERLELTHRASSRDQFARGALTAAAWLVGKPHATYSMRDVLGLGVGRSA